MKRSPNYLRRTYRFNPIGVHIDVMYIRDWFPEEQRRMDIATAWEIVRRFYCGNLVVHGTCPKSRGLTCEACRPHLAVIFDLAKARIPEALATYNAKSQASLANEKWRQIEHDNPASDLPIPANLGGSR